MNAETPSTTDTAFTRLSAPIRALLMGVVVALALTACDRGSSRDPIVVQVQTAPARPTAPAVPPASAPETPSAYTASIGKAVCVVLQFDHGLPSGSICGTLADVRADGLVLVGVVGKQNGFGITNGNTAIVPLQEVRLVNVAP